MLVPLGVKINYSMGNSGLQAYFVVEESGSLATGTLLQSKISY